MAPPADATLPAPLAPVDLRRQAAAIGMSEADCCIQRKVADGSNSRNLVRYRYFESKSGGIVPRLAVITNSASKIPPVFTPNMRCLISLSFRKMRRSKAPPLCLSVGWKVVVR